MSVRDELIEIVTRDPQSAGGDQTWATDLIDAYRAEVLAEAEAKAREVVARLWKDGTTQQQMDRAGGARAVEWEIGLMARGIDEPVPAPDFFQPGRTYLRFVGDRELYFRVSSVSTDNPNDPGSLCGDGPVAYGWSRTDRSTTVWGPSGQTSFVGWHDVTEGVAS